MRVCRLDLLRYGHFSDRSLEFPEGRHDFHIIVGANEAGKSTARNALEDALFGIHQRSAFGFRHGYRDMMVGALIEHMGRRLALRRRKGKANTLLDADGRTLADDALRFFLGGADRNFLERMFSLSHERLRRSGQELSDPQSETAAMIFGAATGTEEIAAHIRAMKDEAATLFTPRRSATRPFYQLVDRFNAASAALSEATITGNDWKKARQEADEAKAHLEGLRQQRRDLSQATARLNRIRLVYPDLKRKEEARAKLAELGDVHPFADDALDVLNAAEHEVSRHDARIEQLTEQIDRDREQAASISIAGALLEHATEITDLDARRIQLQPEREDLPKRRRDLAAVEQRLASRARALGLEDMESCHVPPHDVVERLRELSGEWVALGHARDLARQKASSAADLTRKLDERLDETGPQRDIGPLLALLQTTDGGADPETARKAMQREHRDLATRSEALVKPLLSLVGDVERLASLWVPPRERVQELRDSLKQTVDRLTACREALSSVERDLASREAERAGLAAHGETLTTREIESLRAVRDRHLDTVRTRLVSGLVDAAADAAGDLEETMRQVDEAVDRRFSAVRTLARLEDITDVIVHLESSRTSRHAEYEGHTRRLRDLQETWNDLFRDFPGEPLDPDAMMKWLDDRQTALQAREEESRAARNLAAAAAEEMKARDLLINEASALGMETSGLGARPFGVVRSLVASHCDRLKDTNRTRADIERDREAARHDERVAQAALARAEAEIESLCESWRVAAAGWDILGSPDQASERLRVIEQMRGDLDHAADLQENRIGKIERDLEVFARRVGTLVKDLSEEPGERDPDALVKDLARRLVHESTKRARFQEMENSLADSEKLLDKKRQARGEAEIEIGALMACAGVETCDDLRREIARSREARRLAGAAAAFTEQLARNGDGRSEKELEEEARGIDADHLGAEIDSLSDTMKQLEGPIDMAVLAERQAADALKAINGGDAAIAAASDRQAILAELEELSARYVRAQTGLRLLQWAVDRYRAERQAPLLERASTLFATLTGGSFSGLRLVYDDTDKAVLNGMRGDGSDVDVTGMSDGTVDQLWLALRLAAIDGWLEGNAALPFVADDLFVNFDDARTGAGLKVLHHLAGRCQVLVFTHHAHLVALARQVLGDDVSVISLDAA